MLNPYKLTLLEVADLLNWDPTLPQLQAWRLSTMTDRWSPAGIAAQTDLERAFQSASRKA